MQRDITAVRSPSSSAVRYLLADVDLHAQLPELALEPDQTGLALLLRAHDRPLHFGLHAAAPRARWDAGELWSLVRRDASAALLARAIRDSLAPPPAAGPVDLTVAVCTRGRGDVLSGCLDSLLALRAGSQRPALLVVDNDPPDQATRRLAGGLPDVGYVVEPRPGLDFARNRALAEARTEWVAFVDDDAVADRGWLAGVQEAVAENPDAGAVTGLVLPSELESRAQVVFERRGGFRRGFAKLRYEGGHQPGNPLYPVGAGMFGAGCNMLLRRQAVLELGGFDEALDTGPPLPGGGDLDIFHRVLRAGLPLAYEPRMLVFHRHRREYRALRRQFYSWGDGQMAFLAKTHAEGPHLRPRVRAMVGWWAAYELRELAACAAGRGWGPADLPAAELAGGVAGLTGSYRRSVRRAEAIRVAHG